MFGEGALLLPCKLTSALRDRSSFDLWAFGVEACGSANLERWDQAAHAPTGADTEPLLAPEFSDWRCGRVLQRSVRAERLQLAGCLTPNKQNVLETVPSRQSGTVQTERTRERCVEGAKGHLLSTPVWGPIDLPCPSLTGADLGRSAQQISPPNTPGSLSSSLLVCCSLTADGSSMQLHIRMLQVANQTCSVEAIAEPYVLRLGRFLIYLRFS
ncbi:hypothetical protein D4764_14G0001200 [Takifugu flavidus]|uniref:Uncharacterized protein n=1 Tax=Takifugu flavidus TaxID=433684 RepID=A0A5C6P598_9TELE|nr:hypothetical protein D4764_14G0001200 [Takifugu flavidus]